jgi:large subunit ribosomal protein L25
MEKFKLTLEKRDTKNPRWLRREGKIPATIYGPGEESQSVQVNAKEFSRLPVAAFSHIVELENGGKPVSALIRHVDRRSTTSEVLNVEFYKVAADRKLTVNVPLKFVGVSPAVGMGGQVMEMFNEAEIECFPTDIPDYLEVDMTKIVELEQGIHFSEIAHSDKIKILNPPDEIVVRVMVPRAQVEETPAAAAAAAAEGAAAAAPAAEGAAAPAAAKGAAPAAGGKAPAAKEK